MKINEFDRFQSFKLFKMSQTMENFHIKIRKNGTSEKEEEKKEFR